MTVNTLPATVMVPVRTADPVFGDTEKATLSGPVPLLPVAIQETVEKADQVQPAIVFTPNVDDPPEAVRDSDVLVRL